MTLRVAAATVLISIPSVSPVTHLRAQAPGFGFRLEFGACGTDRFDSFTSTFTKNVGAATEATVPMFLSDAQMRDIEAGLERINFYDFPPRYIGTPRDVRHTNTIPHETYSLQVRRNGVLHVVVWEDSAKPTTTKAEEFRNLLSGIIGMLHSHPAVKALPPTQGGCE